jgi:hypothetical protein
VGEKTGEVAQDVHHAALRLEKQVLCSSLHHRLRRLGSIQRCPILCNSNVPSISPLTPQFLLAVLIGIRFQEVQNKSTTTTSLYFIPCVITGAATNIAAGLLVSRVKANHLALAGALATTIAPVLLANMNLEWSYWRAAFWAMCLVPLSADGIPHPLIP